MQSKKYLVGLLCYVMQFMSQLKFVSFFRQGWISTKLDTISLHNIFSYAIIYQTHIFNQCVLFEDNKFWCPVNVRVFTKSSWDDIYNILQLQFFPEYQVGIKCCFEMLNLKLSVLRHWIQADSKIWENQIHWKPRHSKVIEMKEIQ